MSKKKNKEKDVEKKIKKKVKTAAKSLAAAGKAAVAKPKAPKPAKKKTAKVITNEDIALRAYFIAERRQADGRDGDEHGDWVEAERQLRAEAGQK
ncbi:MAG: DUF2934 domain-containing protein [Terrimicrobiaceae bacterium]